MNNKKSTLRRLQMFVDVILSISAHARTNTLTHHVRIKVQSTQSVSMAGVPASTGNSGKMVGNGGTRTAPFMYCQKKLSGARSGDRSSHCIEKDLEL